MNIHNIHNITPVSPNGAGSADETLYLRLEPTFSNLGLKKWYRLQYTETYFLCRLLKHPRKWIGEILNLTLHGAKHNTQ